MRYGGGTLTATVNGNTMTGTNRDTWYEYPTGTQTVVATMVVEYRFTIQKSF